MPSIARDLRLSVVLAVAACCGAFAAPPPAAAPAGPAQEVVNRVLIDRELRRRTVRDVELMADTIRFRDLNGRVATLPRPNVLALMPPDSADAPAAEYDEDAIVWKEVSDLRPEATGRIELADGQIFPGSLGPAQQTPPQGEKPADKLPWNHALLGRLEFSLDHIALAVFNTAGLDELDRLPATATGDVVGLTNRDRVEGFVMSVVPRVAVEAGRNPIMFPIGRVSFVRFSNPRVAAAGTRLWLHDGTVCQVRGVRSVNAAALEIDPPRDAVEPAAIRISPAEVTSIAFDARRIVPLSSMGLSGAPLEPGRSLVVQPAVQSVVNAPLSAGDIEIPGPMTVEWTLPAGSRRIAGVVELPRNCRIWGDCTVIISAGGEPVRERLSGARPVIEFNIPVAAGAAPARMKLTLDPGDSGPIQDRIILRRTLIAVDPPAGAPAGSK